MVFGSQHCQDGDDARVLYKKYWVATKTEFVVAWKGGEMLMFLNITIKVETIKNDHKMNTAKNMI